MLLGGTLGVYLRTGAPSILTGDQAEHQFTAYVVGVPHATGYPLFTMLNALAVRLIPVGDAARRVTMAVALYSALAVTLSYYVACRLTGSSPAGLLAAVTLALMPEFWSLATVAEVYTLQALLLLAVFLALLHWWRIETDEANLGIARRGLRHPLAAASLLAGLGATHHGSFTPIVAPAVLMTVVAPLLRHMRSRDRRQPAMRIAGRCLLWSLAGFTPWLYLAAQYSLFRPFDYYRGQGLPYHPYWGNPTSWGDVFNLALGAGFRLKVFTHGWSHLPQLLPGYLRDLLRQFWWFGAPLSVLGAIVLLQHHRRAGTFALVVWICATLFGLNVAGDVPKAHVYFLPAHVIWSLWVGVGGLASAYFLTGPAMRGVTRDRRFVAWITLALLLLPFGAGIYRFRRMDISGRWEYRRGAEQILDAVESDAVILCRWETCMPLRYLQLVEERKPGVQLDQTEPEGGANWADRLPLYAPAHPVYAIAPSSELATRYTLQRVDHAPDLWRVEVRSRSALHVSTARAWLRREAALQ